MEEVLLDTESLEIDINLEPDGNEEYLLDMQCMDINYHIEPDD